MEEAKIGMFVAVAEVFKFRKENPGANSDVILRHIINISRKENGDMSKMAMIAAASLILSQLEKNPGISEKDAMSLLMKESNNIVQNIEID